MPLLDFSWGMTGEIKKNTQLVFDPNYFEDPLMENEVAGEFCLSLSTFVT